MNQHLFKVTSTSFDKWFYFAWTDHHLQKFAAIAADMATTMGHIKREELAKAEVLVPPQAEYERIGGLLAPIYDLVVANRIENRKLATLRDELLPRLSHIDLCHLPSVSVCFLTVNSNSSTAAGMSLNKLCALNEHTARTAAGVRCRTEIDTM